MNEQQFDEEKLLKRARELLREEVKRLGGSGFIKRWGTEEVFIDAAVRAERKRAKKLLHIIEKQGTDMTKRRKTKKIKLSSPSDIARDQMKKPKSSKSVKGNKSQSIRKAPRASRSADARRWSDWRESDGKRSKVVVYKADADGNIIAKKDEQ